MKEGRVANDCLPGLIKVRSLAWGWAVIDPQSTQLPLPII